MYHALLTRRYLFSKVMPLMASCAVALCTIMVLVTWSVMGGFLNMLIDTGRTMAGDVRVSWSGAGFPYYEDLLTRLRADPEVAAAAPMIETFGMMSLPNGQVEGVALRGVEGESYASVTQYADILWWRPLDKPMRKDVRREDPRLAGNSLNKDGDDLPWAEYYENGVSLTRPDATGKAVPAIVPGIEVTGLNDRVGGGVYKPQKLQTAKSDGTLDYLNVFPPRDPDMKFRITVLPLDSSGKPYDFNTRSFPVANEFHSGVYDLDKRIVLVNMAALQEMLRMQEGRRVSDVAPADGSDPPTVVDPARVTDILVKGHGLARDTAKAAALRERVAEVYAGFAADHRGEVPPASMMLFSTWEDQNRTFINAVRNEISVLLFLFGLISLVSVFLVLAIFWSMVREKTQDIGVLRSIGAGRAGVAWLWVRYGLAIGVVGSALGIAGSYLVVLNINEIHDWLGANLNIVVWKPEVYYFSKIPNEVEPLHAAIVVVGGIVSCAVGAFVPALRAAWMNPVRALRNE